MKNFSKAWGSSKLPRKQRKYRAKAPLHIKQTLISASLSKTLRTSTGRRSISIRSGDKVKALRGIFAGKEGKVERVSLKRQRIYITGFDRKKRDGSSSLYPIHPSNVQIIELILNDKMRKRKTTKQKASTKTEVKKESKPAAQKPAQSTTQKKKSAEDKS